MFKRIDHVELVTARPERAVAFYTEVLGFRVRDRQRVPSSPHGPLDLVYLELGGTTIELMCYPNASPPPRESGERLGYRMMALEWTTWTPRSAICARRASSRRGDR